MSQVLHFLTFLIIDFLIISLQWYLKKWNSSRKQTGNPKILSTFYIFCIIHRHLSTVSKWFYSLHLLDFYLPLLPARDIRGKVPVKILSKTGSGNSLSSSVESSCSHHGMTPVIPHAPPDSFSWNQSLCSSSPVWGQYPPKPPKKERGAEKTKIRCYHQ